MNYFKGKLQEFHDRFISLKGESAAIAMGMALGVFIGITPTIPFHTALIVLIGIPLKQNLTAAYLGSVIVSNPLTVPILYFTQYEVGRVLLGAPPQSFVLADYSISHLADLGWNLLLPLLTGGFLFAPFFAVPAYFLTRRLVLMIRDRQKP